VDRHARCISQHRTEGQQQFSILQARSYNTRQWL